MDPAVAEIVAREDWSIEEQVYAFQEATWEMERKNKPKWVVCNTHVRELAKGGNVRACYLMFNDGLQSMAYWAAYICILQAGQSDDFFFGIPFIPGEEITEQKHRLCIGWGMLDVANVLLDFKLNILAATEEQRVECGCMLLKRAIDHGSTHALARFARHVCRLEHIKATDNYASSLDRILHLKANYTMVARGRMLGMDIANDMDVLSPFSEYEAVTDRRKEKRRNLRLACANDDLKIVLRALEYTSCAKLQDILGRFALHMLLYGGKKNRREAIRLVTVSYFQDNMFGTYAYFLILSHGIGVTPDIRKAVLVLHEALDHGLGYVELPGTGPQENGLVNSMWHQFGHKSTMSATDWAHFWVSHWPNQWDLVSYQCILPERIWDSIATDDYRAHSCNRPERLKWIPESTLKDLLVVVAPYVPDGDHLCTECFKLAQGYASCLYASPFYDFHVEQFAAHVQDAKRYTVGLDIPELTRTIDFFTHTRTTRAVAFVWCCEVNEGVPLDIVKKIATHVKPPREWGDEPIDLDTLAKLHIPGEMDVYDNLHHDGHEVGLLTLARHRQRKRRANEIDTTATKVARLE